MAKNLVDYLYQHSRQTPHKKAVVFGEEDLTWGQLWQKVDAAAVQFDGLPSGEQQIIGLLMPNGWQFVVAYLAVLRAGHIALPIDVIFKPLEINAILHQVPPVAVIVDEPNKQRLEDSEVPIISFDDLPTDGSAKPGVKLPPDEQTASLLFTSGTTGRPKAVPYTHANHIWNIKVCSQVWGWNADDSLLISLRFSHMHGLVIGLSGALYHGNTLYIQDRFDAKETLEMLAGGKVSFFTHASLAYFKMLEVSGSYDLSAMRLCVSGASPLPPAIWEKFKKRFGIEIVETYGTTETGRIAANPLDERLPGSPGRLLPEVQVKFGEENEILVKSPGVFPGYWHNEAADAAASVTGGWWRTGDLGVMEDGRLRLTGRKIERIRRQGYSVSPRDVEWALHQDPRVKEALVMGISEVGEPNDKLVYFLVTSASEADILDFCKINLPSVWRPDKIVIVSHLPRNHSTKLELPKLRAMVKEW